MNKLKGTVGLEQTSPSPGVRRKDVVEHKEASDHQPTNGRQIILAQQDNM
jgi:hypothetical protein